MESLSRIQGFDHLKALADSRRLVILRLLMAGAMTLSQIGKVTGDHPAQVRHHLKQLERAGLVELVDTRIVRGFVEKYYRARARAYLLEELILPAATRRHPGQSQGTTSASEVIAILGSHDLAIEALEGYLSQREHHPIELVVVPVGSLEGLIALRQGVARLAGCHLLDVESGEYNLPFIRHLFPDRPVILVTLSHRQQGLLLARGNPKLITSLDDLRQPDVSMINRNRGSGTRLWLDRQLRSQNIPVDELNGYNHEACTHTAVAETILQGKADAGLGLYAAAIRFNLDFIPLFEERFDLALPAAEVEDASLRPFLDFLQTSTFRRLASELGGYSLEHSGELLRP